MLQIFNTLTRKKKKNSNRSLLASFICTFVGLPSITTSTSEMQGVQLRLIRFAGTWNIAATR